MSPPTSSDEDRDHELHSVLIANRGEIAVRIARSAREAGLRVVVVHAADDPFPAPDLVDSAVALDEGGPAAYLDGEAIVAAATAEQCDALHPGYGFLSESPRFARLCAQADLQFVGPSFDSLELFADKPSARRHARSLGVPILPGTDAGASMHEAYDFARAHAAPVLIKAAAGGGGRGMRRVDPLQLDEFEQAWSRCASEAEKAFGDGSLYVEALLERARHVEVQVVGDGRAVVSLADRDCTLQRRHQKIVEIAPAPDLPEALRQRLHDDAIRMASSVGFVSLGTFEFLVDAQIDGDGTGGGYAFIEANPRLQVEHTVTEEIFGLDLVQIQLDIASGRGLAELDLDPAPMPHGTAIQCRVNAETFDADGTLRPGGGTVQSLALPSGLGIRLDTHLSAGATPHLGFDPLLAKLIVHARTTRDGNDFAAALRKTDAALRELRLEGCRCNLGFLRHLITRLEDAGSLDGVSTRWIDDTVAPDWGRGNAARQEESEACSSSADASSGPAAPAAAASTAAGPAGTTTTPSTAGARLASRDPLAVLEHGHHAGTAPSGAEDSHAEEEYDGVVVRAPMQGTVLSFEVDEGAAVRRGETLAILEAMKMEHEIAAPCSGTVGELLVDEGAAVWGGTLLLRIEPADETVASDDAAASAALETTDLDAIRDDLRELLDRKAKLYDESRPTAVERRRKTGQRTARENVDDLIDEGSWIEYGGLAIAAQRRRRELDDLIENTPADGLVAGLATVNADHVGAERARCAVLSYDYTVLAGTQGKQNHEKKDRLFDVARKWRLPVVFFTEGGGGRPGDTDVMGVAGLDCWAFQMFGELSGLVPLVGINSGRCFAGNAALLGCCDVVIATENSTIGMGGPAMIEGGGLGIFRPEEVGPMSVQVPNGVVDIAVADEAEAVEVAKRYLSYFQGPLAEHSAADQRHLRHAIPENRLRVYDVRRVIELLADEGSVLELRPRFGVGMITALARIEGKPIGIVANNPQHLAGAIDSPGADKAARFLQLCDAFDLPVLMLCDTPGIMVGPETEKTAIVRHCSRLFVIGASLSVPLMTIVLRKGYGLGAQAMAGGSFKAPLFTVSWPTGEFGGMGLEGAVKLGYRKELAAIDDPDERRAAFERMVAEAYERGKAINMASHLEIDDVIDPTDSRQWISRALASVPPPAPRSGKKRSCIDTW